MSEKNERWEQVTAVSGFSARLGPWRFLVRSTSGKTGGDLEINTLEEFIAWIKDQGCEVIIDVRDISIYCPKEEKYDGMLELYDDYRE